MASDKQFPLALVIKAVDKATGPLRSMAAKLGAITKPLSEKFSAVGEAFKNVGQEFINLGTKLFAMAGAAGFALFHIVHGAMEAGDKLGEMADRVGLTVDAYASLSHAAAQADVDQEQFNGAMDQFNKRLGEAKAGTGGLLTFLNKVSPALAKEIKGATSTEQALSIMTDALARIEDPGKRAALSAAAFGKSGLQMGNFLHQGSAAIQAQMVEFMRLSGSQEQFARSAGELDNVMREAEVAFLGVRNAIAAELFPAFKEIAGVVREMFVSNREGIREWVRAFAQWLPGAVKSFLGWVKALADKLAPLFKAFGGWKLVAAGIAAFLAGPLVMAIGGLIGSIVSLGIAIGATPLGWMAAAFAGIAAAAGALVAVIIVNRDELAPAFEIISAAVGDLWAEMQKLWDVVGPVLLPVLQAVGKVIGVVIFTAITNTIAVVKALVTQFRLMAEGAQLAFGLASRVGNALSPTNLAVNTASLLFGDASKAAPPPTSSTSTQNAHVTVDFANMPKGTRVSQGKDNTAPLDMSLGYSLVTP